MMIPPVSNNEIRSILNYLEGERIDDIFDSRPNSTFYIQQLLNLFPDMDKAIFVKFPENRYHYELKTKNDTCVLLGEKGCRLPKAIRPHFCRIYPFWFFGEEPYIFHDSDCLALRSCDTITEVFLSLGTTPDQLKQIHSNICQDWEFFHSTSQVKMKMFL